MLKALFGPARPLGGTLLAVLCALLGLVLRYDLIEPTAIGALCDTGGGPWWCGPRTALIVVTEVDGLGWLALVLAGLALAQRRRGSVAAHFAMAVGGAGLILYNATLSAVAVVVAALYLAWLRQRAAKPAQLQGQGW